MKKIFLISVIALAVTAGGAFAQMGGGQHMMGEGQQPQAQQGAYGMMGGYGMSSGMMGYGMYPGMMPGYGMYPGMMGGYGRHQPMMGYGMQPGMMGYGTAPCTTGYGKHQPMMGYGMGYGGGYGKHQPMMGYGMSHMYPGAGGDVEKQRAFLKETSKLRRKLHDLMFDRMEAQWNPETKPEQLEKLGTEMRKLQQELDEKFRGALK
jgi:hypothetical protein